jgi:serine/threonine-protein kinase RsbW
MAMVPELRKGLESALEASCANVVLDLAEVTYADSSALGLLVWLDHRLGPVSGRLVLAGANRDVTRILELSGLVGVAANVAMSSSVVAALEGLDLPDEPAEMMWHQLIDLTPEIGSLGAVREEVCELVAPLGFPDSALFDIKVALGEALANAVRHGAPQAGESKVRVEVLGYPDRVVLEVMDNGTRFDGTHAGSDDLYAPGGRGIMFMQALMDRVDYDDSPLGGTLVRMTKHRPGIR